MQDETVNQSNTEPVVQEFKGKQILVLNPGEKYTFSFGLTKAKLIVKYFEAIKKFVNEQENKSQQ